MAAQATRRDAREWALQVLFGLDLNRTVSLESALADFMQEKTCSARIRDFTQTLVNGVFGHHEEIDAAIARNAQHWDVRRMGAVERNVLRIAVFEMLYLQDVPPAVSINEAVDIAKFFSSRESGRFINGILDQIRKTETAGAETTMDETRS